MQGILLIAYYFDPFKGVGSKRMSYWADAFAMESTTKVYDYIGCELDILIVTCGMARTGSIEAVTAKVSKKAFWSRKIEKRFPT